MKSVIDLAKSLFACPSITPLDAGCQTLISDYLRPLGFHVEMMPFGEVTNLYARIGQKAPLLVFAGHTDVVPVGPLSDWASPPFEPTIREEKLFARGACDMKGALAAMLSASAQFLSKQPHFNGSIAFLITSDEEGPAVDGTKRVIDVLTGRGEKIDYCIIGEPSSKEQIGDQIRVGRRGSLHGKLTVYGKQGHVAHPHFAENAIHGSMAPLKALTEEKWDEGNQDFPATSFQITNITSGTGALNVIPGAVITTFNFRFGTASTMESLKERVHAILNAHVKQFTIDWTIGALPFLTPDGRLREMVTQSVFEMTGYKAVSSTGGGTSDGRFIAQTGADIVELGLLHATAHQANENVGIADLELLTALYERILEKIFAS